MFESAVKMAADMAPHGDRSADTQSRTALRGAYVATLW